MLPAKSMMCLLLSTLAKWTKVCIFSNYLYILDQREGNFLSVREKKKVYSAFNETIIHNFVENF